MVNKILRGMNSAVLAGIVIISSGCLAAAAGGVGAGVYYSDRGVQSLVTVSIDSTYNATRQAFTQLGITEKKTSTEQEGATAERELQGSTNDRDVTVTLHTEGSSTRVEVVARKSEVVWDKDLAKKVLEKIVKLAS
jgi:hypothetical protein